MTPKETKWLFIQSIKIMKKGRILFIAIAGLLVFCAWSVKHTNDINKTEWISGTWENKTKRGSIFETWSKTTENELSGKSYMVKGQDTIVFENIRLVQEKEGIFYIPVVKNQNEGLPVRFVAKTISDTKLIFENIEHDFPQIISYTKMSSDSLVAEISGTKNGQVRNQTFPMKRVK